MMAPKGGGGPGDLLIVGTPPAIKEEEEGKADGESEGKGEDSEYESGPGEDAEEKPGLDIGSDSHNHSSLNSEDEGMEFEGDPQEQAKKLAFREPDSPKNFAQYVKDRVRVAPGCPLSPADRDLFFYIQHAVHHEKQEAWSAMKEELEKKSMAEDKKVARALFKEPKGSEEVLDARCEMLFKEAMKRRINREKEAKAAQEAYNKSVAGPNGKKLTQEELKKIAPKGHQRRAVLYAMRTAKEEWMQKQIDKAIAQHEHMFRTQGVHGIALKKYNKTVDMAKADGMKKTLQLHKTHAEALEKMAAKKKHLEDKIDEQLKLESIHKNVDLEVIDTREVTERLYGHAMAKCAEWERLKAFNAAPVRRPISPHPDPLDERFQLLYSDAFRREADRRIEVERQNVIHRRYLDIVSVHAAAQTRQWSKEDQLEVTQRLVQKKTSALSGGGRGGFKNSVRKLVGGGGTDKAATAPAGLGGSPQWTPSGMTGFARHTTPPRLGALGGGVTPPRGRGGGYVTPPLGETFPSERSYPSSPRRPAAAAGHQSGPPQETLSAWASKLTRSTDQAKKALKDIPSLLNFMKGGSVENPQPRLEAVTKYNETPTFERFSSDLISAGHPNHKVLQGYRPLLPPTPPLRAPPRPLTPRGLAKTPNDVPLETILQKALDNDTSVLKHVEDFDMEDYEKKTLKPKLLGTSIRPLTPAEEDDPPKTKNKETLMEEFRDFLVARFGSIQRGFIAIEGKGGNGFITLHEFQRAVSKKMGYCSMADARLLFLAFDSDPDGLLTIDELQGRKADDDKLVKDGSDKKETKEAKKAKPKKKAAAKKKGKGK